MQVVRVSVYVVMTKPYLTYSWKITAQMRNCHWKCLRRVWSNYIKGNTVAQYDKISLSFACLVRKNWKNFQRAMIKEKRSRHLTTPFRQHYIHTPDTTWQMTAYARRNCFRIPFAIFGTLDCRMHTAYGKTQRPSLQTLIVELAQISVNSVWE